MELFDSSVNEIYILFEMEGVLVVAWTAATKVIIFPFPTGVLQEKLGDVKEETGSLGCLKHGSSSDQSFRARTKPSSSTTKSDTSSLPLPPPSRARLAPGSSRSQQQGERQEGRSSQRVQSKRRLYLIGFRAITTRSSALLMLTGIAKRTEPTIECAVVRW